MLNGHGDDGYQYDVDLIANFSSNVWHNGAHQRLLQHIKDQISSIQNYPTPNAEKLLPLIAQHHQLKEENIVITNGATEAFYLIAHAFQNLSATVFDPTFAEYRDACNTFGVEISSINHSLFQKQNLSSDLVFLCNPNNPDGNLVPTEALRNQIKKHPEVTFVIDEAYIDFCRLEQPSISKFIGELDNLIVVKSLTKIFGIPGLRLGYILCNENLRQKLIRLKMPWSVNQMAIEAGVFIFQNYHSITPNFNEYWAEVDRTTKALKAIEEITLIPSSTNYFLIKLPFPKSKELKNYLINQHQLLIRDASNFISLDQHYIRFCPQTREKNQLFVDSIKKWLQLYS